MQWHQVSHVKEIVLMECLILTLLVEEIWNQNLKINQFQIDHYKWQEDQV